MRPKDKRPKIECPSIDKTYGQKCTGWKEGLCNLIRGKRCAYFELNCLAGASEEMRELYRGIMGKK